MGVHLDHKFYETLLRKARAFDVIEKLLEKVGPTGYASLSLNFFDAEENPDGLWRPASYHLEFGNGRPADPIQELLCSDVEINGDEDEPLDEVIRKAANELKIELSRELR